MRSSPLAKVVALRLDTPIRGPDPASLYLIKASREGSRPVRSFLFCLRRLQFREPAAGDACLTAHGGRLDGGVSPCANIERRRRRCNTVNKGLKR